MAAAVPRAVAVEDRAKRIQEGRGFPGLCRRRLRHPDVINGTLIIRIVANVAGFNGGNFFPIWRSKSMSRDELQKRKIGNDK